MTETLKAAIVGGVAGAVVSAILTFSFTLYMNRAQDAQRRSEKQTDAQKASMIDFTQSLETILYDLNNKKVDEFEANASKFEERMTRSEFSAFLETRDADDYARPFANQVSVLRSELNTYRDACRQHETFVARYEAQGLPPEIKRLLFDVPAPSPLTAILPLNAMIDQLRTEMAVQKVIRK